MKPTTIKNIMKTKIETVIKGNPITPDKIKDLAKNWQPEEKNKRGRRSVLADHIETIRYLRGARKLSYKQISEFFNQNGIKVSYQTMVAFSRNNKIGGGSKNKTVVAA